MPTMSRRAMRIVEVKIEGHSFIGGVFHLFRGRNAFETELHGLESGGSDGEEKRALLRTPRADQQDFSGRENIGMVAGNKFNHGHFAGLSAARPKRANAFQRCSEGNHRACRERHADIPANGGFIPDLKRCKERATTHAENRRRRPIRWRFFYELIEFDNPASSSNL